MRNKKNSPLFMNRARINETRKKKRVSSNKYIRHSELVSESLHIDYEILKYIQDDVQC